MTDFYSKGRCLADCIICHRAILFEGMLIAKKGLCKPQPSPLTYIRKHYRKFHPKIFDTKFRR